MFGFVGFWLVLVGFCFFSYAPYITVFIQLQYYKITIVGRIFFAILLHNFIIICNFARQIGRLVSWSQNNIILKLWVYIMIIPCMYAYLLSHIAIDTFVTILVFRVRPKGIYAFAGIVCLVLLSDLYCITSLSSQG